MIVIKRDGRKVKFNEKKIIDAIIAAAVANNIALSQEDINKIVEYGKKKIEKVGENDEIEIEQIQDIVIEALRANDFKTLANKYSAYRLERNRQRERGIKLMETIYKIGIETDRDNANVGNNFSAKLLRIASEANKWQLLTKFLPREIAKHHDDGDYYIHDLDSYNLTTNCLHLPTRKLLTKGFNTGYGTINPAKSIQSAGEILCIALQASQNDMFGGQSHPNFDNDLAVVIPTTREKIKKTILLSGGNPTEENIEKLLKIQVHQAMQGVVYNLNTMHSRAGSQVPFSSLNIGIPENDDAALICEAFLEEYEKGLGCGEQPIFPNIIFRVKQGVNRDPQDKYYYLFRLACRVASKRMNPTFMNIDATFNKKYYDMGVMPATMGCRTYLLADINGEPRVAGRGNIAPVTINLPRLAMKANKNLETFFNSLDEMVELCRLQLMHRYDTLKKLKVKDMPFVCGEGLIYGSEGLDKNDSIEPIMKHGTWGIGFTGLAETLRLLIGSHHGETKEARELGLMIVKRIRERCDQYKEQYKLNFSCYATPAEGLSGKFFPKDEREFGKIEWVTTKGYYTNSFHVPVDCKISLAEKIAIEAPYHELCNGGHISYVEFDNYPTEDDICRVVTYAYTKTNINYMGINFHIRYCLDCKSHD